MDFSEIGRQFGLNEQQTRAALDALAPVVAAGMRRNAASDNGLGDLLKAVVGGNHRRYVEDPAAIQYDAVRGDGDAILGHIFGSKDVSRGVAQQLSATSGIGAEILKKLLPVVAAIVMGQVAKKMGGGSSASGGGLGDILGDVLGGALGGGAKPAPRKQASEGGLGDILKDVLGGGTVPGTEPEPQASPRGGQGGSLEDILGDILGGGGNGRVVVKQIPPGQMEDILRDILGGGMGAPAGDGEPRSAPPSGSVTRGRKTLDDMLGGGSKSGKAADDLLNSVDDMLRRR
jgi:hypothetical protein